jgi:hypothetical protein
MAISGKCCAFSAAMLLCSTLATADEGTFQATGTAAPSCLFTAAPTFKASTNMHLDSAAISQSSVSITNMLNTTTGKLKPAFIQIRYKARCNYAHSVKITSEHDGMLNTALDSAPPNFLNKVYYTANVAWGGRSVNLTTLGTQAGRSIEQSNIPPSDGDLNFEIDVNNEKQFRKLCCKW